MNFLMMRRNRKEHQLHTILKLQIATRRVSVATRARGNMSMVSQCVVMNSVHPLDG